MAPKGNKNALGNNGGRPTKYHNDLPEIVYKLCLLGATDEEISNILNITTDTFYRWKKTHSEFSEAIYKGKEIADANVAKSLYDRACGYSHPEDKIFNDSGVPMVVPTIKHYPPDTKAATMWLKNRRNKDWHDKHEFETNPNVNINIDADKIQDKTVGEIAMCYRDLLKSTGES